MSSFGVLYPDIVASQVFKAFATSFSMGGAGDVGWEVIEATLDDKD